VGRCAGPPAAAVCKLRRGGQSLCTLMTGRLAESFATKPGGGWVRQPRPSALKQVPDAPAFVLCHAIRWMYLEQLGKCSAR